MATNDLSLPYRREQRTQRWKEITSGELLWDQLTALAHQHHRMEKWEQLKQALSSWKKFLTTTGRKRG